MFRSQFSREGALTPVTIMISLSLVLAFLTVRPSTAIAVPHKVVSPEDVTRQFYSWYLGAHLPNPKRSNMPTFRKYVTQSFLKRATARDVESILFVAAQDTDETWANNFTVSPATVTGQKATVQVDLNGKDLKQHLQVTLRNASGVWRIDDVKGSD